MPPYPIEPDALIRAANMLAPAMPGGRPPYTAHRRAISTAYYALFHALTSRIAGAVFPTADPAFRNGVRRWIGHGDIRTVAGWATSVHSGSGGTPPAHIARLLAPSPGVTHIDGATAAIADAFLELHERRELADYDHEQSFSREDTLSLIALATRTVAVVEAVDSREAAWFFGLIAMQARIQPR